MDYKGTLNLPKSIFPMKANLGQNEPITVKKWLKEDLYGKMLKKNKGKEPFILHDGPPYANGNIHIGHALNKVLKDIIIKYHSLKGYYSPYIPGWDCHGLPIEHKVSTELGPEKLAEMPRIKVRQKCEKYARKFVKIQSSEFQRLGCLGDWSNPYLTINPLYEKGILEVFKKMVESGSVFKSLKPVYWCADCATALAEAEVEYQDHKSPSIYVRFAVKKGNENLTDIDNLYFVIWTTTPWTIPANVAICLNPNYKYAIASNGKDRYVIAEELLAGFLEETEQELKIESTMKGSDLEKVVCQHPFLEERESLVILGDHVTLEAGTGCVHTAPGHGQDDYAVGMRYGLEVIAPVDNKGCFTSEFKACEGMHVFKSNEKVIEMLEEKGALMQRKDISHSYPHCWRCKEPIIFRATEQWFISIDENNLREKALEEIQNTQWVPKWGINRILNMVKSRGDWCISRQRSWGVPIPAFFCEDCGEVILNSETLDHIIKIVSERGTNAWYYMETKDLLPEGTCCPKCSSSKLQKEYNILDVWFESGVSHHSVLDQREGLQSPAQMYLEGSDQHRGWFQSALLTGIAYNDQAPFETVLTHGFLLDGKGKAMHKSAGNAISPLETCDKRGADVLRLWVSSENYQEDVSLSPQILDRTSEAYRKIRNSVRFMINNLYDFDPEKNLVAHEGMLSIDKYLLAKLQQLIQDVEECYKTYAIYKVFHLIYSFVITELSAFYLDVAKDRLYTLATDSKERRSCQTVIYQALRTLTLLIAPILSFTAEEIWNYIPGKKEESIFLEDFPKVDPALIDNELVATFDHIVNLKDLVNKAIEIKRNDKVLGHSLEAKVSIFIKDSTLKDEISRQKDYLETILIVSEAEIADQGYDDHYENSELLDQVEVTVTKKEGKKCPRCWRRLGDEHYQEEADICIRCQTAMK